MEEDQRFSHLVNDQKFRRIPKTQRKVKIDKRFKSMFKDEQFKIKYTVDKRGRPASHTSNEDLKRYYELSSGESSTESEEDNEEVGKYVRAPSENNNKAASDDVNSNKNGDKSVSDKVKKKLRNLNIDYARGESKLLSESSSDDEESEEEEVEIEDTLEHAWGELDRDAERTEEITYRLAACNMDWDRIKATDLMVLLSSFLPPGGLIRSVTIYPSEFGLQRMKEEEIKGPTELVENKIEEEEENEENEEGSKYHMEKLRQYQLNRLRYYYAVIVCDSKNTANKIYTECDGLEYESSATKMDLRFIPDDMTFEEKPKEVCEKLPEQGKYQPRFFTTTALQQAKVDLTWDETNPDRIELTQKLAAGNVDEIADGDLEAYLASSSGEEEPPEEEAAASDSSSSEVNDSKSGSLDKYKALLQDIENKESEKNRKDVEMEISWGIDLKNKTEKLVKQKLDEKISKTPFQQYLDKRKEKRKSKREERKKKHEKSEDISDNDDVPSDVDMNDPYFAEEFDKPEFKKTRNKGKQVENDDGEDEKQKAAELELLLLNPDDDKKHFSLQKIQERENESKSKKKLKKSKDEDDMEDDFKINVQDARFSALYSSHHFNIDPTDSHYKKTKGTEALVKEKLKRRNENDGNVIPDKKTKNGSFKGDAELNVLVKSVKRKTEALSNKKRY